MKKIMMFFMAMLLSFTLIPVQLNAASDNESPKTADAKITVPLDSAGFDLAITRIKEIKEIDKSELKPSERKDLRNELNALTTEVKNSPYYYISGGAILLIVLLIILL